MLMARSSLRFLFSTNNELLCGHRCDQMPLFKSTGVGEKAEFVVGMVRAALANRTARVGVGNIARTDKIYAVAGVGSVTTCTGAANVSTAAFGASAASSFGFGAVFIFGLGAAFTIFWATFFAAFTRTGRCFRDAATLAFFRFAAVLCFGLAASAFFALSSCQRFF